MAVSTKDRRAHHVSRRAERRLAAERSARRNRLLRIGGVIAVMAVVAAVVFSVSRGGGEYRRLSGDRRRGGDPARGAGRGARDRESECAGDGRRVRRLPVSRLRLLRQQYEHLLFEEYVATGKVRFEYRDYAFIGEESTRVAEAAFCALDQGAFWPYHQTLFANQHGENEGAFSAKRLRSAAEQLGLDGERFATLPRRRDLRGPGDRNAEQEGLLSASWGHPASS